MNFLRIVLLGLATVLIGVLGWQFAAETSAQFHTAPPAQPQPPSAQALAQERPAIEAAMAQAPEFSPFFTELKTTFPTDYARMLDEFAARALERGQLESPEVYLLQALRALRQTRGVVAAQAGSVPLAHIFDMQAGVMAAMAASDPRLCVEFLYGGTSPAFYDFAARNRALIAGMAQAELDAIVDGQNSKIQRPAPTDADFDQFQTALQAKGLDATEIGALLDGKTPDPPLAADRMCQAGRTYLDVLHNLPDDPRLNIYALAVELMARS